MRVGVAAVSGSLSIIITVLDAALDVLTGGILWFFFFFVRHNKDFIKFPLGKVSSEFVKGIMFWVEVSLD